ncbi:MAG: nucleotidyltransferase [Clostridiales bacterium]|nr:nucleotidyltransferase [Clostridiales bacterium]
MRKPVLLIIAGGMGSRFGGPKQTVPVDEKGHWIIDFSIYDAARAGFASVVCVTAPGMEDFFKTTIGERVSGRVEMKYVPQYRDKLPEGFNVPEGRVKPWGTAHAVLSAKGLIDGPFAVINADDFYGADAYKIAYNFLSGRAEKNRHGMVGYRLDNTLTEHGSVSRAVCEMEGAKLLTVTERKHIVKQAGGAAYKDDGGNRVFLPGDTLVSLNLWCCAPGFMDAAEEYFAGFLRGKLPQDPLGAEYYLPDVPNALLREGRAEVEVLRTSSKWLGVTYSEDLPVVKAAIAELKSRGEYPGELWKGNDQ